MTTDEQAVAPSATPEPVVTGTTTPTLDRLTTEERASWRKTGQLPDVKADSSPASPDKAVSTETSPAPASEPGTPKPTKKNAESRIQELLAERAQLRSELDAARRPAPSPDVKPAAASSAPPSGAKFPEYDKWAATQPAEGQSYEDYIDARARHVYQQERIAYEQQQSHAAAQREANDRMATYQQAAETFINTHPDYWDTITPVTDRQMPMAMRDLLQDTITRSSVAPALLYHLGTHLDQWERILSSPPAQAVYELGKIDASLTLPASATPVVKTLSTAPEPPPSIRSKATTPVDDVDAAVKRGDFASYKLAMNRRSVAAR